MLKAKLKRRKERSYKEVDLTWLISVKDRKKRLATKKKKGSQT